MYEPSPPPIIPNFSFRGLRCDHCIRDAAGCKAVLVARTCGRLNAAQMVDPVLQLVIISLRETLCPVVHNLVVNLETRTDDRFCGQRQTDRALFTYNFHADLMDESFKVLLTDKAARTDDTCRNRFLLHDLCRLLSFTALFMPLL